MPNFLKNRNNIFIGIAIVGVVITAGLIFGENNPSFSMASVFGKSKDEVGKAAIDYINNSGLSNTPASLVGVSEESGLVKIKIKIGTAEFDSYATKDGKLLFPQGFDMAQKKTGSGANSSQAAPKQPVAVQKNDSPSLEAYVVSRCPFGLQMQRAIADAVKNLPSLAQYVKVRYIGAVSGNTITAMHGDAEAKENLRQICIRDEQPSKYWPYVSCQMIKGDTAGCEASTGVDSAKLSACMSTPSKGVAYAQKDFELATKYNVQGSPTLILNSAVISESSYGGRSSEGVKSMACDGFNSKPSFCSTKLNTAEATTSFSADYSSGNAANLGNSGSNGANCAPVQ